MELVLTTDGRIIIVLKLKQKNVVNQGNLIIIFPVRHKMPEPFKILCILKKSSEVWMRIYVQHC